MNAKQTLDRLIASSKVQFNGQNPWDPQIRDERTYARILAQGSLGLGESYMDGWWDCADLPNFFCHIVAARLDENPRLIYQDVVTWLLSVFANPQSITRSKRVGEVHYDLTVEMFEAMLGPTMAYSCGYWPDANDLTTAQEQKYDLVCRKLQIKPGDRVLEIGCGWGGFLHYVCEKYNVHAVGVTISENQAEYARQHCQGFDAEIFLTDYRTIENYNRSGKPFDKIVSIGMFEHVGEKNYATFFEIAKQLLAADGLFLLHTIGSIQNDGPTDPWLLKYIFPHGRIPRLEQMTKAFNGRFVMEDLHNFGADYDKTLCAWRENFDRYWKHQHPDQAKLKADDQKFYRMWDYYLASCAGTFRARNAIELWQFVLSPNGVPGGYRSVR